MLFRQLIDRETCTYTYLLADQQTKEAVLIDPVLEQVERDHLLIQELGLELMDILDTHVHADHITGSGPLRERTGARVVVPAGSGVSLADVYVSEGSQITFGSHRIEVLETPGHTETCVSYLLNQEHVFTGDALLVRGTGRTDFQGGSPLTLHQSITQKLFILRDNTQVWPGHDYKGRTSSSIGEEKRFNPRLAGKTAQDYAQIMESLNLALPRKIDVAVPGNQVCGMGSVLPDPAEKNVTPDWVANHLNMLTVLDVRGEDEYNGDLGHIKGSVLVRPDHLLEDVADYDKHRAMVVICRSGKRSMKALEQLRHAGFHNIWNMAGGMLIWEG